MILVNGSPESTVPADDRGLAYGDGLFETIEIKDGKPVLWKRHMHRLQNGCERLGFICDTNLLAQESAQLCQEKTRGVLKIILTRGSGGRGYRPDPEAPIRRVLSVHAWPDYPEQYASTGIRLYPCQTPLSSNTKLAGLKTLCRLEQVLAQMEWQEPDYQEGLMLDMDGRVIEGTRSNVFMAQGEQLLTPTLKNCGIKGIMREVVLAIAADKGISVQENDINHTQFCAADELFVCNSIIGIWPVSEYAGRAYAKGPLTTDIQNTLQTQLDSYE